MNTRASVAYWPVACDLSMRPTGHIEIGPETKIACDGVIKHSRESGLDSSSYVIIPAAGISPDPKWKSRIMSHVMVRYFEEQRVPGENLDSLLALTFNTQGEAYVVASYVKENQNIKRLVISVKWWHALRCYAWLSLYFKKFQVKGVAIEVLPLQTQVDISTILFEFWKATPFNLIRMLKVRYFG